MLGRIIERFVPDLESVEAPTQLNTQQIKFCLYVIQGYSYIEAVKQSHPIQDNNKIKYLAQKLKKNTYVQAYIRTLNKELERAGVANALHIQLFLTAAAFTPVGEIDKTHPLCQKQTVKTRADRDGTETTETITEGVNKMEALKTLIKMKGYEMPAQVNHNFDTGVMLMPASSNVEEWTALAANSQRALMEDAAKI